MELTDFEIERIKQALWHAERNASPLEKSNWAMVLRNFSSVVAPVSNVCRCEDRPCCSCDGDVYQPAGSVYDRNDPNNYDPEEHFERMEAEELEREACSICATYFEDDDNEDDVVQGFHAECAEAGNE